MFQNRDIQHIIVIQSWILPLALRFKLKKSYTLSPFATPLL